MSEPLSPEPRKKISDLTEVTSPLADDLLPIVSGGATKRVLAGNLIKVISGLSEAASPAADDLFVILKDGTPKKIPLSAIASDFALTLLDDADAVAARATLGITAVDPARGFISGLTPSYKDADEITIRSGVVDINGVLRSLDSSLDKQIPGLGASTWYYLYAYVANDSVITLGVDNFYVHAAPTWSDALKYWHKADTPYSRCIGVLRTDGSGSILPFKINNHLFSWDDPLLLVSASAIVSPLTALGADAPFDTEVFLYGSLSINSSYSAGLKISQDGTNSWYLADLPYNASSRNDVDEGTTRCATNGSRQIYYEVSTNSGSMSATIEQLGFILPAGLAG